MFGTSNTTDTTGVMDTANAADATAADGDTTAGPAPDRDSFQSDTRSDTQTLNQNHQQQQQQQTQQQARQPTGSEPNMERMRNASDVVASVAVRVKRLLVDDIPRPRPLSSLSSLSSVSSSSRHSTSSNNPNSNNKINTPPHSPIPPSPSTPKPLPLRISSLGRSQHKRPKIAPRTSSDGVVDEVRMFIRNVAKEVSADPTDMTVFMSSPNIQKLAHEFFSDSQDHSEKPYYTAETIFWNLQYIEGGDESEYPWVRRKPSKRGWQASDHLTRFILLSERSRLHPHTPNPLWQTRDMPFEDKVNFYLCVLRCFAFREKYLQ